MPLAWTPPATRWHRIDATDPQASPGPDALGPLLPGLHPLIDRLLRGRGVENAAHADRFLTPKLTHLHNPATLPGCVKAAQRLKQAVQDQQPIIIYGDYDVDGVTASAILYHTLTLAGANVATYVPHRLDEGYGLSDDAIAKLIQDSPTPPLIVSVDCGITAVKPARVAKDLGADLIITDHHEFDANDLPEAYALVHPGLPQADSPKTQAYENRELCGAGVAYKLAWQFALEYTGCEQGGKLPDAYRALLLDLLALTALGTVADVMPLVGENRAITAFGLRRISHTSFEGLNALIDASKLRSEKIDSYHIGFVLGPRLNACGRMGHAKEAVELLTTATGERARELAEQLHLTNEDRRATERDIVEQATQMVIDLGYDQPDRRAIVLAHEDWHPGVVGIVASRLVERFCRPVVMLCIDPTSGDAKGSARSVDGVAILDAIHTCAPLLTKFGGHAMAAGMSLPAANIDAFRAGLINAINQVLQPEDLTQTIRVDTDIAIDDCTVDLVQVLQSLAPFGRGNPKPRLIAQRVTLDRAAQRMGQMGKHLSMHLRQGGKVVRAVAWNMGERAEQLPGGAVIDVVFQPTINEWQGRRSAELHVSDFKPA